MAANADVTLNELVIERIFDVPRRLAFEVWTRPAHLKHWWGPRDDALDFSMPACETDFRPGGRYRFCISSPSGEKFWQHGEYREIVEPERLVFTFAWGPEGGQRTNQMLVQITFTELGPHKTSMRFVQTAFETLTQRDGHRAGWNECFDRLIAYFATVK